MSEQVKKKLYIVNHKSSLPLMLGGNDYKIPSGTTSLEDLADKLDVPLEQALKVAQHAASTYGNVRPPTGAKERQKPPQKWVELVTLPEDFPAPQTRLETFQEIESELSEPEDDEPSYEVTAQAKAREEILQRSFRGIIN